VTEEERVRLLHERIDAYNEQLTYTLARAALVEMTLEENPGALPDLEKLVELLKRSGIMSEAVIKHYRDRLPELQRALENLLAQEDLGVR